MSEYYCELFNDANIYKLSDTGYVYHLNAAVLEWEEISGVIDFNHSWTKITEEQLHESMLIFYEATSKYLIEIEHVLGKMYDDKKPLGKHFRYYQLCSYVVAVDENDEQYTCQVEMLVPTKEKVIINTSWKELDRCDVIGKIKEQGIIDLSKCDVFLTSKNDIYALSDDRNAFYQSMYNGEITAIDSRRIRALLEEHLKVVNYDDVKKDDKYFENYTTQTILEARSALAIALEDSIKSFERNYKIEVGPLIFYRDPFGVVYAKNQTEVNFLVTTQGLSLVGPTVVENEWERIPSENVLNVCQLYEQRLSENLNNDTETLFDLNLYYNLANEICGISQEGETYKMDKVTGEIKRIPEEEVIKDEPKRGVDLKECVKKQAEVKYYYLLNEYIDTNEKRLMKDGREGFGDSITFYGKLSDNDIQVFALDSNLQEYICTLDSITPIARGTITDSYVEYQDKFVLAILQFESQAIKDRLEKPKARFFR